MTSTDTQEALDEAMFALSARLKLSGFLDDGANHAAYERVVAVWTNRRTPPTPATEAPWEGPLTDKENAMLKAAWQKHKDAAPPTPAFNDHGCIYCRAQGADCEGPHKFATEEREAVAQWCSGCHEVRSVDCYRADCPKSDTERRAAEILAAEANERARIVAWLRAQAVKKAAARDHATDPDVRDHCDSSYLTYATSADAIEIGAGK